MNEESTMKIQINLKYIPKSEQTNKMVYDAIMQFPWNIKYAAKRFLTKELCEYALNYQGQTLKYIPKRLITIDFYEIAVKSNGLALKLVPEEFITKELATIAVKSRIIDDPYGFERDSSIIFLYPIKYVPASLIDERLVRDSIKSYPCSIKDIPQKFITAELCMLAVLGDPKALEFVPEQYIDDQLIDAAISFAPAALKFVPISKRTKERCQYCFDKDPRAFSLIPAKLMDEEMINKALSISPSALQFLSTKDKTQSRCQRCFAEDPQTIQYIPQEYISMEMSKEVIDLISTWTEDDGIIAAKCHDLILSIPKHIQNDKEFLDHILSKLSCSVIKSIFEYDESEKERWPNHQRRMVNLGRQKPEDYIETFTEEATWYLRKNLSLPVDDDQFKIDTTELSLPTISSKQETRISVFEMPLCVDTTNGAQFDRKNIYYITDIHLEHQMSIIADNGLISRRAVNDFIETKIKEMLEGIDDENALLLVGGDVAGSVWLSKIFYEKLAEQWPGEIISILGNHELWNDHPDPEANGYISPSIDELVENYKIEVFDPNDITLLHNALYIDYKGIKKRIIGSSIQFYSDKELKEILDKSSLIILGGIGFTGLDPIHNALTGIYRAAVTSLEADKAEAKRFAYVYNKVKRCAKDKQVIVFTHTPVRGWTTTKYNPNWIYINGHTHMNGFIRDQNGITVLSDNQIGYTPVRWKLNSVIVPGWYDPFKDRTDGIYNISKEEYLDFNRARGIYISSFRYEEDIYMIKKCGMYMFVLKTKYSTSLLSGGKAVGLRYNDPQYYYINMEAYSNRMLELMKPIHDKLYKISKEVKQFGGDGRIHGFIVDISFYSHIYLNVEDGKITPYFAKNMVDKFGYNNLITLLDEHEPTMSGNYLTCQKKGLLPVISGSSVSKDTDIIKTSSTYVPKTDIYKSSNKMRSIQYMLEQKVIRIWNDDLITNQKLPLRNIDNIPLSIMLPETNQKRTYKVGQTVLMKAFGKGVITDIVKSGEGKTTIKFDFSDGSQGSFSEGYVNENIIE